MYKNAGRIWELDFLKGIALLLMIYFHIIYDLKEFYGSPVNYAGGFNYYAGKAAGALFIFTAGISSTLSRSNIKRGLRLLALAMVITLATHLYNPALGIKFGILHFLGLSILLSGFFLKLRGFLPAAGALVILLAPYKYSVSVNHDWFFILGITTGNFISSDYYPFFPWLGLFLFGLFCGRLLYGNKKSVFVSPPRDNIINTLGRHTLSIYLVHQPLILILLTLAKRLTG